MAAVRYGAAGLCLVAAFLAAPGAAAEMAADTAERGAYLVRAAGCIACHTDHKGGGAPLAGGRALKTPFGTFYSPNLTPDRATGIGGWRDDDFLRALREGVAPDGSHYFPIFPYTSYTRMTEADALAIKAYLDGLAPVRRPNRAHDLIRPFSWRRLQWAWKWLFFEPGPLPPNPARSASWNRGAYLVEALGHCGECHTPRNLAGGLDRDMWLAGTPDGPDGELVANITPHPETGIGKWSRGDIASLLETGLKPNYDDVQGSMEEAIEDGLKYLTEDDRNAIADYLLALPPIDNKVVGRKK